MKIRYYQRENLHDFGGLTVFFRGEREKREYKCKPEIEMPETIYNSDTTI